MSRRAEMILGVISGIFEISKGIFAVIVEGRGIYQVLPIPL
jgi:hypothetical protein